MGSSFNVTYIHTIFISALVTYVLGSHVGAVPLHSPLSWQVLELFPFSRYPELQVYVAVEAGMLPDGTTWPFAGPAKSGQFTAE